MRFTTTIILLVLVVALGLYLALVDRYKPSTEELERVEKRVVQQFAPERVTRIDLDFKERAGGTGDVVRSESFELERGLAGWNVLEPFNFPADETIIRSMLDSVKKIDRSRIVVGEDYEELDRDAAGLDDPDVVATFFQPDTALTFRVGLTVPSVADWDNYVEVAGRSACFFVPTMFRDALILKTDSSARDVRRRRVFSLRKYLVNALVLERSTSSIELRRGDDLVWRVIQPVQDYADTETVETMVQDLSELEVTSFIPPTNFGRPMLTLNVSEGAASQRLLIGPRQSDRGFEYYPARRAEFEQYFTLDAAAIEPFLGDADSYRSKLLVVRNPFEEPEALTQVVDGQSLVFEERDRRWRIAGFDSPLVDDYTIEDYVYRWTEMTITSFVSAAQAQAALSSIWINLTFKYKNLDQTHAVALSHPVNGLVYSERTPGAFVALDAAAVNSLLATSERAFLRDELLLVPADAMRECRVVLGGVDYLFMQGSNGWAITVSNAVATVRQGIADVLDAETSITVQRYVAKVDAQGLSPYGLASPAEEYTFTDARGDTYTLLLGVEAEDGSGRYAMLSGQPYVAQLTENAMARLLDLADVARVAAEQALAGDE